MQNGSLGLLSRPAAIAVGNALAVPPRRIRQVLVHLVEVLQTVPVAVAIGLLGEDHTAEPVRCQRSNRADVNVVIPSGRTSWERRLMGIA